LGRFESIDHTADLGLVVWGETPAELFAVTAVALGELIAERHARGELQERRVQAAGADWEDLLVNFLREVLFLVHGEAFLPLECDIAAITPYELAATLRGEPYDPARHTWKREIKAVTYHGVEVTPTPEGWRGRVIFDV
jgi:SHS2 domain-containing protein